VAVTGQPYAFTGDDPLNATDPLGNVYYSQGSGTQSQLALFYETILGDELAAEAGQSANSPSPTPGGGSSSGCFNHCTHAPAPSPSCSQGSHLVGGQCTGTGAGQPCPDVASDGITCLSSQWNSNNVYDQGAPAWPMEVIEGVGGGLACIPGALECLAGGLIIGADNVGNDAQHGCSGGNLSVDSMEALISAGSGSLFRYGSGALDSGATLYQRAVYQGTTGVPTPLQALASPCG
jgi:hypothetical protein